MDVPTAAVAKMQAKAAQLAAELGLHLDKTGTATSSSTDAPPSPTAAAGAGAMRMPGSLAAPRRMSQANLGGKSAPTAADTQAALLQCQKLEAQVQLWKSKHLESERELQRHQESYTRREEQLHARLQDVEQRLQQAAGQQQDDDGCADDDDPTRTHSAGADADAVTDVGGAVDGGSHGPRKAAGKGQPQSQPLTLEHVQQQMQCGVEELLQHQRLQLRADEAQQLRQFRGRLAEIEAQLQADKRAAAADQDSWMSKTLAVREELARTQEIAVKLDAMYRLAEDEAAQLRVQFSAQEDDRQHLIRQVLGLRRQNHHLQQQVTALQEELDAIMSVAVGEDDISTQQHQHRHQHQHQQVGTSGQPYSASPEAGTQRRPMTAGCTHSSLPPHQQEQEQGAAAARWRPMSGSPQRRTGLDASHSSRQQQQPGKQQQQQQQQSQRVIQQLQRALQCERRQLRQVRAAYTAELGRRNELQSLLLDSIQEAKQQCQQAAAAQGAARLQQQQQQHEQPLPSSGRNRSSSRPSSKMQARPHQRPLSAVPCGGGSGNGRQQQRWDGVEGLFAPSPAVASVEQAGASSAVGCVTEQPALDSQAWHSLLDGLLRRKQLLELLLERACPDFVQAAQQLHQGQTAANHQQHSQQDLALNDQPGVQVKQQHAHESEAQRTGPAGAAALQESAQLQCTSDDSALGGQDDDTLMIQQDSGSSQGDDGGVVSSVVGSEPGCSKQDVRRVEQAVSQQQQQQGQQEGVEDKPAVQQQQLHQSQQQRSWQEAEGLPAKQQQHVEPPLQEQQQQQRDAGAQVQCSPAHLSCAAAQALASRGHRSLDTTAAATTATTAAAPAAVHHFRAVGDSGGVTLASMSGPVMGYFPVRKLLHSSSSSSSSSLVRNAVRPDGVQLRVQQRVRPESAATGSSSCCTVQLGQGAFSLRPMSAAAAGVAAAEVTAGGRIRKQPSTPQQQSPNSPAGVLDRSSRSSGASGCRFTQSPKVCAGAGGGRRSSSSHERQAAAASGGWGAQADGQRAGLAHSNSMLKSFLAGQ